MRSARDDRGVVLPLVALCLVAILMMVAIVIDLGATRSARSEARSAADAAAAAGATGLSGPNAATACADAFAYAFQGLGGSAPSAATISSACSTAGFSGACGATVRSATLTVGTVTVKVQNPVPNGDTLLQGTSLGSGVNQNINTATDGAACDRLGVEITEPQPGYFRGVFTSGSSTFTVHSVARYSANIRRGPIPPALVALNRTTCAAIDAGNNGNIVLRSNAVGPGIAFSDSDGSAGGCSGTNAILGSRSSGRLFAESSGSTIGQLAWYEAASSVGYNSGGSTNNSTPATWSTALGNYVGDLFARAARITRLPADQAYHCRNVSTSVQPLCVLSSDPVQAAADFAALATPPSGFTTYAGPCDTVTGTVTLSGKVWVDCPTFTVKGGTLNIVGGSIVMFEGTVSVEAGGTLLSNTTGGGSGYPTALDSTSQTTVIIKSTASSALAMQSTSSVITMAQTMVYSRGGVDIQGSPVLRWTPPSTGTAAGLLYWSESTQQFSIQGGPTILANGVVFHGNGQLVGGGGGTIDLTHVQMWVDKAATNGSTTLMLAADPANSIKASSSGSALIR